jgi:hypothetical protein
MTPDFKSRICAATPATRIESLAPCVKGGRNQSSAKPSSTVARAISGGGTRVLGLED